MTFRLYHSLSLLSFTTGLPGDIVVLGGSIRALCGGIPENWRSKVEARRLNCNDADGGMCSGARVMFSLWQQNFLALD